MIKLDEYVLTAEQNSKWKALKSMLGNRFEFSYIQLDDNTYAIRPYSKDEFEKLKKDMKVDKKNAKTAVGMILQDIAKQSPEVQKFYKGLREFNKRVVDLHEFLVNLRDSGKSIIDDNNDEYGVSIRYCSMSGNNIYSTDDNVNTIKYYEDYQIHDSVFDDFNLHFYVAVRLYLSDDKYLDEEDINDYVSETQVIISDLETHIRILGNTMNSDAEAEEIIKGIEKNWGKINKFYSNYYNQ